jgi:hypothetical protein
MKINIEFLIEKEEALRRVKKLIPKLKEDFNGKISDTYENWNGNTADFGFKALGSKIKGVLQVLDKNLVIEASLPFAAFPFKGLIESKIREIAIDLLKP